MQATAEVRDLSAFRERRKAATAPPVHPVSMAPVAWIPFWFVAPFWFIPASVAPLAADG